MSLVDLWAALALALLLSLLLDGFDLGIGQLFPLAASEPIS